MGALVRMEELSMHRERSAESATIRLPFEPGCQLRKSLNRPSDDRMLLCEEALLPSYAPAIAAEITRASSHSVTGDHNRNGIARAGVGHSARARRSANRRSDLRVRARLAEGNLTQCSPHALLARRTMDIERHLDAAARATEMSDDGVEPLLDLAVGSGCTSEVRRGIFASERTLEGSVIIA